MSRRGDIFAGVTTAILTPFENGQVDEDGLRALIDFQVEAGIDAIAPVGTTGESPTLTHEEHERVIAIACEHAAGRIKIMAGTGSNSTDEAISLTKFAKEVGATGSLQVAPYYNKPTQEGFYQHYAAIAKAVDIPIVVYNIPGRCGANILPSTIARIAEFDNVVAVKEATGSLDQASEIASLCDLSILSGDDSLTLPLMSVGGSGVVSVASNIVPQDVKALVTAFQAGDIAEAQSLHRKLFPLCRDMLGIATNPIPVKTAVKLLGRGNGELRLPMTPLTDEQVEQLTQTLRRYELLT